MASELEFAQESIVELRDALEPLFERHWREVETNQDTVPLEPDWQAYECIEAAGIYSFTTARTGGVLVGYVGLIISPALHHRSVISAEPDLLWLAPEHRRGLNGYALLMAAEENVIARGVKRIGGRFKIATPLGPLFRRAGYVETERVLMKMVG